MFAVRPGSPGAQLETSARKQRRFVMFGHSVQLELAKQKSLFLGVLFLMAVVVMLTAGESLIHHKRQMEVLGALLTLFAVAGIPLLGLIFGTSAATELRTPVSRQREETLPFSA